MMESIDQMEIRNLDLHKTIHDSLIQNDRFLVTTHIHPDGDSIASLLIFGAILDTMGKDYRLIVDDSIPRKFDFLEGVNSINTKIVQLGSFVPNVCIVLDSSNPDRTGNIHQHLPQDVLLINIDHHPSNSLFGNINLVDIEESSTTEIVYALLEVIGVPITEAIASMVYSGIICDTGRFLFPNTTFRSLSVCTQMIDKGVSPSVIGEKLYCRTNQTTIKALAVALSTLDFYFEERVACISLSNGTISKLPDLDTEGFVDYLLAIEGTVVEFFMFEMKPGLFRISFRSKNIIDVNEVAKGLGGGGHARAAGCIMQGELKDVKNRILEELKKHPEGGFS